MSIVRETLQKQVETLYNFIGQQEAAMNAANEKAVRELLSESYQFPELGDIFVRSKYVQISQVGNKWGSDIEFARRNNYDSRSDESLPKYHPTMLNLKSHSEITADATANIEFITAVGRMVSDPDVFGLMTTLMDGVVAFNKDPEIKKAKDEIFELEKTIRVLEEQERKDALNAILTAGTLKLKEGKKATYHYGRGRWDYTNVDSLRWVKNGKSYQVFNGNSLLKERAKEQDLLSWISSNMSNIVTA